MNEKLSRPLSQTSLGDNQEFHVDPIAYDIVKIDLYPHNVILKEKEGDKTSLDLRPQVDMILITESIFQSALHVSFGIIDAVGILDELRIQGGEKIHLRIEQNIKKTVFNILDTINNVCGQDVILVMDNCNTYCLLSIVHLLNNCLDCIFIYIPFMNYLIGHHIYAIINR